jgi:hypothetical protein
VNAFRVTRLWVALKDGKFANSYSFLPCKPASQSCTNPGV